MSKNHVMMLSCFSGGSVETYGPQGFSGMWRDPIEGVDWLIDELNRGYRAGVREFMLNRPMGRGFVVIPPDGDVIISNQVPGASWHTLEPERRERLQSKLRSWVEQHSDARVGVFVGMRLRRATTSFTAFDDEDWIESCHAMDPDDSLGQNLMLTTLGGWMSCGVSGFYFDVSSHPENRRPLVRMKDYLEPLGIKVVGEAIPSIGDMGDMRPDPVWADQAWIGTESFIQNFYPGDHHVPDGSDLYDWITWTGEDLDLIDPVDRHARAILRASQGYTIIAGLDDIQAVWEADKVPSPGGGQ